MSVAPPTITQVPAIPAGVLAHLLDRVGGANPLSPRHRLGDSSPITRVQRGQLESFGLVDRGSGELTVSPAFADIARVILEPHSVVDVRLWNGLDVASVRAVLSHETGVAVNEVNGMVVISGPVTPKSLGGLLAPVLPGTDRHLDPGVSLDLHLTVVDTLAFAAVFEATRSALALGVPTTGLPLDAVIAHSTPDPTSPSADDFRLLTRIMGRATSLPTAEQISTSLHTLASTGLVTIDGATISPAEVLVALAGLFPPEMPGWRWQRTTQHAGELTTWSDHLVITGVAGAALRIAPGAPGHLALATVTTAERVSGLASELAVLHNPPGRTGEPPVQDT